MAFQTKIVGTCVNDGGIGSKFWSNPGNATADDNTDAQTQKYKNSTSNRLKGTMAGNLFSIPSGATIDGIRVRAEIYAEYFDVVADFNIMLIKGGTAQGDNKARSGTTYWPTVRTVVSWGGSTVMWGLSLDDTDVNASDFGAGIASQNETGVRSIGYCDYIQITVWYTEAEVITGKLVGLDIDTTHSEKAGKIVGVDIDTTHSEITGKLVGLDIDTTHSEIAGKIVGVDIDTTHSIKAGTIVGLDVDTTHSQITGKIVGVDIDTTHSEITGKIVGLDVEITYTEVAAAKIVGLDVDTTHSEITGKIVGVDIDTTHSIKAGKIVGLDADTTHSEITGKIVGVDIDTTHDEITGKIIGLDADIIYSEVPAATIVGLDVDTTHSEITGKIIGLDAEITYTEVKAGKIVGLDIDTTHSEITGKIVGVDIDTTHSIKAGKIVGVDIDTTHSVKAGKIVGLDVDTTHDEIAGKIVGLDAQITYSTTGVPEAKIVGLDIDTVHSEKAGKIVVVNTDIDYTGWTTPNEPNVFQTLYPNSEEFNDRWNTWWPPEMNLDMMIDEGTEVPDDSDYIHATIINSICRIGFTDADPFDGIITDLIFTIRARSFDLYLAAKLKLVLYLNGAAQPFEWESPILTDSFVNYNFVISGLNMSQSQGDAIELEITNLYTVYLVEVSALQATLAHGPIPDKIAGRIDMIERTFDNPAIFSQSRIAIPERVFDSPIIFKEGVNR